MASHMYVQHDQFKIIYLVVNTVNPEISDKNLFLKNIRRSVMAKINSNLVLASPFRPDVNLPTISNIYFTCFALPLNIIGGIYWVIKPNY